MGGQLTYSSIIFLESPKLYQWVAIATLLKSSGYSCGNFKEVIFRLKITPQRSHFCLKITSLELPQLHNYYILICNSVAICMHVNNVIMMPM